MNEERDIQEAISMMGQTTSGESILKLKMELTEISNRIYDAINDKQAKEMVASFGYRSVKEAISLLKLCGFCEKNVRAQEPWRILAAVELNTRREARAIVKSVKDKDPQQSLL